MKATTKDAYDLQHQGSIALAEVEHNGIRVDVPYLERAIKEVSGKIHSLEEELKQDKLYLQWKKKYGSKTNLRSRDQLGDILFNVLKYPCLERTATGRAKADEEALRKVPLPFVSKYLEFEKLHKGRGNYLYNIQREVVDGYFHPSFNLHTAQTFRSSSGSDKEDTRSSRDFNLQNVPGRNRIIAEIIRKCFVPRKGRHLGEIDFSGIEVRVAYCYHKDSVMKDYLTNPESDMHRDQACELFILPPEQVEKKTSRDWAKNRFVFPQFYGSVYFQCAPHLWEAISDGKEKLPSGISFLDHLKSKGITELGDTDGKDPTQGTFVYHVKQCERKLWERRFTEYTRWKNKWWEQYQRNGHFTLYTGYRIEGVYKRNEVLNYAIQGSAFHCLLWSLIQLQKWLRKHKLQTKIVGEIHDSLLVDFHPREVQDVIEKAHKIMTEDLLRHWEWLIIGMEVEPELGAVDASWFDKKTWIKKEGIWQEK